MFGDAVIPIPLAIRIVEEFIATHAAGNFGAKRNPESFPGDYHRLIQHSTASGLDCDARKQLA
jgi:hypothetical protein